MAYHLLHRLAVHSHPAFGCVDHQHWNDCIWIYIIFPVSIWETTISCMSGTGNRNDQAWTKKSCQTQAITRPLRKIFHFTIYSKHSKTIAAIAAIAAIASPSHPSLKSAAWNATRELLCRRIQWLQRLWIWSFPIILTSSQGPRVAVYRWQVQKLRFQELDDRNCRIAALAMWGCLDS